MKMFMLAGAIFAADIAAVALIFSSLWIEHSLGLAHGIILDFVFVAAISYGVAAWIVGSMGMRLMKPPLKEQCAIAPTRHHKWVNLSL
jgi:hypothetical protein